MDSIRVRASAKINLVLDVVGKREDGYHNLSTIMHEIPLYDDLTLTFGGAPGVRTKTNFGFIREESNIASKAARAFFDAINLIEFSLGIKIHKRIPVGSGLGGGSADAAAVLKALNGYYGNRLTFEELTALGSKVGADVPFCLHGGCALCEGIGDIITPLPKIPACNILIVKPKVSISTAELFAKLDLSNKFDSPNIDTMISALQSQNLSEISREVSNVLESAASITCPEIMEILRSIATTGAIGTAMSGSGSAAFGIYSDPSLANDAYNQFTRRYRDTFLLQL